VDKIIIAKLLLLLLLLTPTRRGHSGRKPYLCQNNWRGEG